MQVSDLVFPLQVDWGGHDYTLTESTADPDFVNSQWHPKETADDALIAARVGTFFASGHTKEQIIRFLASGIMKEKK